MDEYIKRDKALAETWKEPRYTDAMNALTEIRDRIRSLPTEDVQPVVHCRECIWLIRGDDRLCEDCVCDNAESPVFATDEDFGCIYGERKGEDNV